MKVFEKEFDKLLNKIQSHEPFAFSRWADGETMILNNESYSLSPTSHFYTLPEDQKNFNSALPDHQLHRKKLWEALRYKSDTYHIGIVSDGHNPPDPNVCRWGIYGSVRDWMIENSGSDIENITFANIFINQNYYKFRDLVTPLFPSYKTVILCNERSTLNDNIFSSVTKDFRVGSNCIINDMDKIDVMAKWVEKEKPEGHLFLFAASSLGNLCIHKLHQIAPNNTFIDVGSALNPYLQISLDRGYLAGWSGKPWRGMDTAWELTQEEKW